MVITFEEIKKDHKKCVESIAKFLDCDIANCDIEKIVEDTTFDAMKARPLESYGNYLLKAGTEATDDFFREGKVGSWRNIMTLAQEVQLNEMIKEKYLPLGIDFY